MTFDSTRSRDHFAHANLDAIALAQEPTDAAAADGARWGCVSVDRASRCIIAWAAGPRTPALAEQVVATTQQRAADPTARAWVSDGWDAYAASITAASWEHIPQTANGRAWTVRRPLPGVCLTPVVKHRRRRRLVEVEVRATLGEVVAQPSTVHIERLNGVPRDRLAWLTRKTHAFAKATATWDAAVTLALVEHNWLRAHPALRQPLLAPDPATGRRYHRRTPAMAIGLADQCWTWEEFLTHRLSQ